MSATAPLPDYPAAGAASWCELNEFAVLDFQGHDLLVERHIAPMSEPGFRPPEYLRFTRGTGVWQSL